MEIKVSDLHKSFGENYVLRGVDLTIEKGKSTVIIGGSGSGKSVLLKHLIGLYKPDSGSVFIDGQDICLLKEKDLYPIRKRFGMIFQSGALLNSLSVEDNVALGLREHEMASEKEIMRIVNEKLELVKLADKGKQMPTVLSGGMRKRVAIARALTMNPEIILYDEPTAGLDPPMADNIDNLILELNDNLIMTSVVVTHDMASVFKIADYIYMIYEGKIIEKGTIEDFKKSDKIEVKEFISRENTII